MLTIRSASKEFKIPERAVRQWVADGVIPSTRVGNRAYVDPEWVRNKLARDGTLEKPAITD